ncbi:MAG: Casein kinase I isoform gamma-2 [Paramarteilia canceri]
MMVMQLLGPNLHEIYEKQNKKFSDSCLYKIVYLMITILEYVHSKGIVYRDIKPENFLTRKYLEDYELYIADFGLSTYFIDQSSGKKFPKEENQSLVGTTRYMSTNAHSRLRQAPRDDLESVAYVAAYFISGKLPWQVIIF